jgi:hypothetical protein
MGQFMGQVGAAETRVEDLGMLGEASVLSTHWACLAVNGEIMLFLPDQNPL